MFASACTAAAGSPLTSPSLKHVIELTHAHVHTRSPPVGLGMTGMTMLGQGVPNTASSSSAMHAGHGPGQPRVLLPRIAHMQTQDVNTPMPHTPRLQCTPVFPSVFSLNTLSPTGAQSPFVPEGSGSDDNVSSELREAMTGGNRFMKTNAPGRPKVPRPRTGRWNNLDSNMSMPCTPRLQYTPALPSVFPPFTYSTTGARSPLPEGYDSDDNVSPELRQLVTSASRSMNANATDPHRVAAATNNIRSTVHSTIQNLHPEVERIGLGISGIVLNQSSISNVSVNSIDILPSCRELASDSWYMNTIIITPNVCRKASCRRRLSRRRSRALRFKSREHMITSTIEPDGYAADTEREGVFGPHRRLRNCHGLALSGFRSCKGRMITPFCGRNGDKLSWL